MAVSMAGFTFNDALTKSVTGELTVAQIMFVRGAFTAALVYIVARRMGALDHIRNILQPLILLRIAFETVAAVAFHGPGVQVEIDCGLDHDVPLRLDLGHHAQAGCDLRPGAAIAVSVPPDAVHLFAEPAA